MATNPDSDTIVMVFERQGGESERTRLFRNVPVPRQEYLLARAGLAADEAPVISYFGDETAWCLITDQRLVWTGEQHVDDLNLVDFSTIDSELDGLFDRWDGAPDRASWHPKTAARKLRVHDINGKTAELLLDPGPPYYVIWNLLLWLCRRANNQRAKDRDSS